VTGGRKDEVMASSHAGFPDSSAGSFGRDAPVMAALAWLVHPVTVAATMLLIVNDHVLKAAYPGLVTGKLSDVVGLVMAPPVVAVLLALLAPLLRPVWHAGTAVALVGVLFAAVKASPVVAGYASAVWSVVDGPSVVLADPTDLLALPALAVAWWVWRTGREGMPLRRWVRLVAVLVVLPVAILAIAATTPPYYTDAVVMTQTRDKIVVGIDDAFSSRSDDRRWFTRASDWYASDDEGLTFHRLSSDELLEFTEARMYLRPAGPHDCSPQQPDHCFRVVPRRLAVQQSHDGGQTWRMAWEVTEAERARLAGLFERLGDVEENLSSHSLLVRDQADGGVVVLVANRRDGLARRDTSGRWERVGFVTDQPSMAGLRPVPIPDPSPPAVAASAPVPLAGALAVAGIVVWIGAGAALHRVRRSRRHTVTGVGLLGMAVVYPLCGFYGLAVLPPQVAAGLVSVSLLVYAVVVLVVAAGCDALTAAGVGRIAVASLAAAGVVFLPYAARATVGWPSHTVAEWLALLIAGVVVAASIPLAVVHARRELPHEPVQATG
jgi:hypothetical protein